MKYSLEKVVNQSVLVEFTWQDCGSVRTIQTIFDSSDKKCVKCCMSISRKGLWKDLQYDLSKDIVFFKKQGNDYIAWIKFSKLKWVLL